DTIVIYQLVSTVNGWGYIEYTNSKGQTFHGYVKMFYIKSDNELKSSGKKNAAVKPKTKFQSHKPINQGRSRKINT
ncbi:hypothetical protein, partial [Paraburkholderia sp. SIMBA_030]|uniref:hypothetical protein n=1 Tax=Paraburkholderia sp. SIMBA_030 TaxID=3085773 RepID=UPI00397D9DE6